MSNSEKNTIDQALDLFVYGPLGIALFARDALPGFVRMFVSRGRSEIETRRKKARDQVNQAHAMGKFAVSYGGPEVRRRVEDGLQVVRGRAEDTLSGLVARREGPRAPSPESPIADGGGAPEAVAAEGRRAGRPIAGNGSAAPGGPSLAALPIPDYDALSASQVVERLHGLARAELDAVRSYEHAHRGRRTVLGKIAQLQS